MWKTMYYVVLDFIEGVLRDFVFVESTARMRDNPLNCQFIVTLIEYKASTGVVDYTYP